MHRPAQRLTRILVCAGVVPVVLVASGCSVLSGSDDTGESGAKPSSASSASGAAARPGAFSRLPDPCKSLSKGTLDDLVPKANSGTHGRSDDTSRRGSCSYSSLDNNGVDGSQFRWLSVTFARFATDPARGDADKLASDSYDKQVAVAKATEGAARMTNRSLTGIGDEATAVGYDLEKKEGTFKQQTVVTRTENVVITVDYDGAGLAGEKTPDAGALMQDAQRAAEEAVAAVARANASHSASPTRRPSSSPGSQDSSGDDSSARTKKPGTRKTGR